jgi:hypothetical protein
MTVIYNRQNPQEAVNSMSGNNEELVLKDCKNLSRNRQHRFLQGC